MHLRTGHREVRERYTLEHFTQSVIVTKCHYENQIKQNVIGGPCNEQARDEYCMQIVAGMPEGQTSCKSYGSVALNAALTRATVWTSHKSLSHG